MMKENKTMIEMCKLSKLQLIKIINTLENDNQMLENTIKEKLYKTFMDKLQEPQEINRLRKTNKNLRLKIKTLNSLLKGEKNES